MIMVTTMPTTTGSTSRWGSDEVDELFDFIMFSTLSQANNDFRLGEIGSWSGVDLFSKVEILEPPEDA